MKELRAFFELTGVSLLPLLLLFLSLYARPGRGTGPAEPSEAPAAALSAPAAAAVTAAPVTPAAESPFPAAVLPAELPAEEGEKAPAEETEETEEHEPLPEPPEEAEEEAAALPAEAAADVSLTADETVTVDILFGSEVRSMSLRDYLLGVVAAEMPASFAPAALEAQAVAARTDTLYRLLVAHPHAGAACCTDPGCCKAYCGPEELRRRWGADYDRWAEKIAAAVDATAGEVLTYGGEPIFAAFHAASAGRTEDSENVWIAALPYLRSVPTGETAEDVPGFLSDVSFPAEALRARILEKVPGADLPEELSDWLTEESRSASGRLLSVSVGGVTLSGSALRSLLGLRSAAVRWRLEGEVFTFETAGYGHGVGLSQYGAEVMAREGKSCREILLHYYTGAELGELAEVFAG